jgi:hypothetical protein
MRHILGNQHGGRAYEAQSCPRAEGCLAAAMGVRLSPVGLTSGRYEVSEDWESCDSKYPPCSAHSVMGVGLPRPVEGEIHSSDGLFEAKETQREMFQ